MQIFLIICLLCRPRTLVHGFSFRQTLCLPQGPQALEVAGNTCSLSDATPYLLTVNLAWPCGAAFSALLEVFSCTQASSKRIIFACMVHGAGCLLYQYFFAILYHSFNTQGSSLTEVSQQKGYICLGFSVFGYYRQRFTNSHYRSVHRPCRPHSPYSWLGFMTAIFMHKDSKRDVQVEQNIFADF